MSMTEQEIKKRYGTRMPYRVPDDYFDRFADNLMDCLPEPAAVVRMETPWWRKYRQVWVVAACVCGLVFGGALFLNESRPKSVTVAQTLSSSADADFDQMADYAMFDSEDIYASLYDN